MKPNQILIWGIVLVLLTACGPSPEEVATMTASAWTPTPVPPTATPTPTPVPYDLTVTIIDEIGAPIEGANVVFPESGNGQPVQSDAQGKFSWSSLAGESATFKVSAQGYFPADQTATLQRGSNDVSVTLKRDPFGLLPSEACAADEKLLYAEDFQDNHAQGWNEIDLKTPGWDMVSSAEDAGNIILSAQYTDMLGDQGMFTRLEGMEFDNAAWRFRHFISKPLTSDQNWFGFNWRFALQPFDLNGQQVFDSRYQMPVGTNYFSLRRLQQPVTNIGIGSVKGPKAGEWHLVEISTFQNVTEVWLDGKRLLAYEDPQPLPPGTMGFEIRLGGSDAILYFDNLSVCELGASFTSIAPAAP